MSSNRPELVALRECLEAHADNENLLYLTDSEATLQAINKGIGGGSKLSLVKTADADILRAIIVKLQQRVKANETRAGEDVEHANQQDHLPMVGGLHN
jgi:ribonuclease HI